MEKRSTLQSLARRSAHGLVMIKISMSEFLDKALKVMLLHRYMDWTNGTDLYSRANFQMYLVYSSI